MKNRILATFHFVLLAALPIGGAGCRSVQAPVAGPFSDDVRFLNRFTSVVVLKDKESAAQVAVTPLFQGRVMTSTCGAPRADSFGWINRDLITSSERQRHINAFGGEDRFWLGPEGGQYGLFFTPDSPFDLENWYTPEPLDWGAWPLAQQGGDWVQFIKSFSVQNRSGTRFHVLADRTIWMVGRWTVQQDLGVTLGDDLAVVAFESDNRITNIGSNTWDKAGGLLSIWILGMFQPSSSTTVVIPYNPAPAGAQGASIVNDAYFGKIPADRLKTDRAVIFFKGDGAERGKIGIPPGRAKNILGSYDGARHVLTLVQYSLPSRPQEYVNSTWEIQEDPYAGDVVNSYNDGPPAPGARPLGPFYELETSSPAAALAPGASIRHTHRTIHIQGPEEELDRVSRATLGVAIKTIRAAFQ